MKVFKFGGASVKDAQGVRNLANIIREEGVKDALIVVSAMGKMTNTIEGVLESYLRRDVDLAYRINQIKWFHLEIIEDLFPKGHEIYMDFELIMGQMAGFFATNKSKKYDFVYDQVVGFGELLSTKIIAAYLDLDNIACNWLDVRDYIKTNSNYREAEVNWHKTKHKIARISGKGIFVTQGFLGADTKGKTTTLGREGSDFSAAIFAFCLGTSELTIWKDVEGVLNADPRYFEDATLLHKISYDEVLEMAFYGASVIHPKTIKPLENKGIKLRVRSFLNLETSGTLISHGVALQPEVPCFILKQEQVFLSISAKDFSFMVEHNLSEIFKTFHQYKLKVNLIQNSALSFSVCLEDQHHNFDRFIDDISRDFKVSFNKNVLLYTIRHATISAVKTIEQKGDVLLKQMTGEVVQIVTN